ncbi:DinB family protein [Streptomyces sp. B6B3]|uniref:DinB family protein n=1 Tax=Streptomyces sp. B6B3 TaxID=3153570 RepID=UPI00325D5647
MDGDTPPGVDWPAEAVEQLDWHWRNLLRPRFDGLTDEEYLWEPAPGCWSVRRRADGTFGRDGARPEPDPPPLTTIAWRIGHLVVDILGGRAARHFGGPPVTAQDWSFGGTAAAGLGQLDEAYDRWTRGVRALGPEDWARPCGPAERYHPDAPMAALVLHINREALHHSAEIALLRDLYRAGAR